MNHLIFGSRQARIQTLPVHMTDKCSNCGYEGEGFRETDEIIECPKCSHNHSITLWGAT